MELTPDTHRLLDALEQGLPLTARPYAALGERAGLSESATIDLLGQLIEGGVIKRFGLVVRHHELGYRANAMVVWDIPAARVEVIAEKIAEQPCVSLCYQRPRQLPDWPYNLFCMIHGKEKAAVRAEVERMAAACGLADMKHDILFSCRRFKQRGARYSRRSAA